MRAVLAGLLGAAAGVVAGYLLFSPEIPSGDASGESQANSGSSSVPDDNSNRVRRARADKREIRNNEKEESFIDLESDQLHLPLNYWDKIEISCFTPGARSPWDPLGKAFALSEEAQRIFGLDALQSDAIRRAFLEAREGHLSLQWSSPNVREEGDAVIIELAPAPAGLESTLEESIASVMGERQAELFFLKARPTLDWEFGGFGKFRRVLELKVLPDGALSLRESLRRPIAEVPDHLSPEQAQVQAQFEVRTRQYRVDRLPPRIAELVEIQGDR